MFLFLNGDYTATHIAEACLAGAVFVQLLLIDRDYTATAHWPIACRDVGPAIIQPLLLQAAAELSIIRQHEKLDREYALAKSEWSFKTAVECSAALAAKKVSAVELAQDAIARIERHDAKINAVCVRDFARGLEAARAADAALARGESKAAARPADDGEGILQCGGAADDLGLSAAEGFQAAGRRAVDYAGEGRGRRDPRQDQRAGRARRLAELQRHLRHHQQSLRPRPHAGRLLRRIVGGAGRGLWAAVARLRHRRLAARAGVSLRRLCAQADLRPGAVARPHAAAVSAAAARSRPGGDRADGALGRRSVAAARRDRGARSAGQRRRATGWRCRRRGTASSRIFACC